MYLVLIAGGHCAGKRTVTRDVIEALRREASSACELQIDVIDLSTYLDAARRPQTDFPRLLADLQPLEQAHNRVVFVHGNYALFNEALCERAQMKVFLDTDADVRLSQWILRDSVHGSKIPLADVLQKYLNDYRSEYDGFIEGTKYRADVLLPRGSDALNIELIATGILEEVLKKDKGQRSAMLKRNKPINLRAEAVSSMETRFYSTN